ncbi:predicted protein [Plenodomus lingam JN3]|uniref:Predicted protein n=1 Tax=Leptosphaeria maculans (strain JN3 / isolate v23.1.3 / race Av1-4-5-6-7-8) TaxID=985895 RepID=E4ZPD6_LEPMJ|nr:predicted protein [Plenodomus lingam JN3]CBX93161.1 predicted protein [Plenodomus lingam JN3]
MAVDVRCASQYDGPCKEAVSSRHPLERLHAEAANGHKERQLIISLLAIALLRPSGLSHWNQRKVGEADDGFQLAKTLPQTNLHCCPSERLPVAAPEAPFALPSFTLGSSGGIFDLHLDFAFCVFLFQLPHLHLHTRLGIEFMSTTIM